MKKIIFLFFLPFFCLGQKGIVNKKYEINNGFLSYDVYSLKPGMSKKEAFKELPIAKINICFFAYGDKEWVQIISKDSSVFYSKEGKLQWKLLEKGIMVESERNPTVFLEALVLNKESYLYKNLSYNKKYTQIINGLKCDGYGDILEENVSIGSGAFYKNIPVQIFSKINKYDSFSYLYNLKDFQW